MIKNIWSIIEIVCGCNDNHQGRINLKIQYGPSSPFYACPKYFEENRVEGEHFCANRLNFIEYEKMVNHICNLISTELENNFYVNLTNFSWKKNGYSYKIISYSEKKIIVSVVNEKVLLKSKK